MSDVVKSNDQLRERIIIDIKKFNDSINLLKSYDGELHPYKYLIDKANRYNEDCKYFLEKEDLPTSFGCIVYAHGIMDAVLIILKLKE